MKEIDPEKVYMISTDLISRQIEECIVIVPLDSGIGKLDEDLYSLNETGKDVWDMIDGKKTLVTILHGLSKRYNTNPEAIHEDVIELISDLLDKGLIVEVKKSPTD
ncbi:hypothetical protein HRM2_25500 [Desulforapulum autotrophicum HRM2]|uniref:PqqD family protein n=1 Tax=Desulforapulum autotrophicum (strain ATCC 43914 / DSM 3382 / VKM B-1955 / HRM2) TaxID=177437 RepID=C0QGZ5_DESAH|nr:PqqD family protein [Desulforapulum autotrophicum]ACN15644.1 hypothetical protein HRM2_25500 [Desulforapulum autotrophicum HRM2]